MCVGKMDVVSLHNIWWDLNTKYRSIKTKSTFTCVIDFVAKREE